ncbi:hypothetical protein ACFE04_025776 [Oxalis oulophora]
MMPLPPGGTAGWSTYDHVNAPGEGEPKPMQVRSSIFECSSRNTGDGSYASCSTGACALRLADDIVGNKNNVDARVLIVPLFLVMEQQLLLWELILIYTRTECPLFHIVSTFQTSFPGSAYTVMLKLWEMGLWYCLKQSLPSLVGSNVESCLDEAFGLIGIKDWNSLFYSVHPDGAAIINQVTKGVLLERR